MASSLYLWKHQFWQMVNRPWRVGVDLQCGPGAADEKLDSVVFRSFIWSQVPTMALSAFELLL